MFRQEESETVLHHWKGTFPVVCVLELIIYVRKLLFSELIKDQSEPSPTDRRCTSHVNTSLQEVAKIISKLAGGPGQIQRGAFGGLDHLIG